MLTPIRTAVAAAATFLIAFASGCSSAEVGEASCNACGAARYTAEECHAWGQAAGCESSAFVPGSQAGGCNNGCSFTNCDRVPSCEESSDPEPARDAMTPPLDPRCERSDNGLYSVDPPCSDAHQFNLNGVKYYYCPCSSTCPCDYECGSIPLSVGGTIGSACAPK